MDLYIPLHRDTHTHTHTHITFWFSFYQLMDIWGCFHFLAIVNTAFMNICIQVFVEIQFCFSLGHVPSSRTLIYVLTLCLFKERPNCFQSSSTTLYPTSNMCKFQFLSTFTNICYCLFYFSHPSGCELIYYYGFDFHFPNY